MYTLQAMLCSIKIGVFFTILGHETLFRTSLWHMTKYLQMMYRVTLLPLLMLTLEVCVAYCLLILNFVAAYRPGLCILFFRVSMFSHRLDYKLLEPHQHVSSWTNHVKQVNKQINKSYIFFQMLNMHLLLLFKNMFPIYLHSITYCIRLLS